MTTKISKNTGDTTRFEWDIENKLTEVRKPGMIAKYVYDALGRRMSKTVNGETKKFGYDGQDLILEMNGQDSITANYTHGPGIDNPLMMNRAGKNYYYAKDGLGSVTALTDSTGNVVHEYKYSVFGEIVEEIGESVENPFTFTSRELDRETGLMYYRARYYDPEIGRFLSEDPIGFGGGDANLYRYCWNNSIGLIDPFGLCGGGGRYQPRFSHWGENDASGGDINGGGGYGGKGAYAGGSGAPEDMLRIGAATIPISRVANKTAEIIYTEYRNQVVWNNANSGGKLSLSVPNKLSLIQTTGKVLGGAAVGFSAADIMINGRNSSNLLNTAAGLTFFVAPPVGPVISGTYSIINLGLKITTGYDIGQYLDMAW